MKITIESVKPEPVLFGRVGVGKVFRVAKHPDELYQKVALNGLPYGVELSAGKAFVFSADTEIEVGVDPEIMVRFD